MFPDFAPHFNRALPNLQEVYGFLFVLKLEHAIQYPAMSPLAYAYPFHINR
jgi:hypothetical protein